MADNGKACPQSTSAIRKRKERFSDDEVDVLIREIMAHAKELYGPNEVSSIGKVLIWEGIVRKLNKVGGMDRALIDCKKRWSDYKRKIRRIITQVSAVSLSVNMECVLSPTQLQVAKFFRLNEVTAKDLRELENNSPVSELWDQQPDNKQVPSPLCIEDSEYDSSPVSKKSSTSLRSSCVENDAQDQSVSQSLKRGSVEHKTNKHPPKVDPTLSHLQKQNVDVELKRSLAFQKETKEMLLNMQKSVSKTLKHQKKMQQLLKNNFEEMEKSLTRNQKKAKNHEYLLDARLKTLESHLCEMKETLFDEHHKSVPRNNSDDDSTSSLESASSASTSKSHKGKKDLSRTNSQK